MPRLNGEGIIEYHMRIFKERPLSLEAIKEAKELCDDPECSNMDCIVVKGLISYIEE